MLNPTDYVNVRLGLFSPNPANRIQALATFAASIPKVLVDGNAFIDALKEGDVAESLVNEAVQFVSVITVPTVPRTPNTDLEVVALYFNALGRLHKQEKELQRREDAEKLAVRVVRDNQIEKLQKKNAELEDLLRFRQAQYAETLTAVERELEEALTRKAELLTKTEELEKSFYEEQERRQSAEATNDTSKAKIKEILDCLPARNGESSEIKEYSPNEMIYTVVIRNKEFLVKIKRLEKDLEEERERTESAEARFKEMKLQLESELMKARDVRTAGFQELMHRSGQLQRSAEELLRKTSAFMIDEDEDIVPNRRLSEDEESFVSSATESVPSLPSF